MLGLPSDNDANTSSDVDECDCFSFGDVSNIDDDNDGDDDDDNKVAGTSPPASSLLSCVRVIKWVRKISIFNSKQYRVSSITCLSLDSSLSADAGADDVNANSLSPADTDVPLTSCSWCLGLA